MKSLVAYFSVSGNTKQKAEIIANYINADLLEIKPTIPYTKEDLDYFNPRSRTSVEMDSLKSRPDFEKVLDDIYDYDVIFLGFPIWWYTCPRIVLSFLESYNFIGKTIIPFATASTSGFGNTLATLKRSAKDANFIDGTMLSKTNEKDIQKWLDKII